MDDAVSKYLRSNATAMAPDEALRARPGLLIGVTPAAEAALAVIQINSIFDLAASRLFAAANALLALEDDPTAVESRLNVVPSDVAEMPSGVPARELAAQPIAILRGIGDNSGAALAQALDVITVRDIALWPPYHAAKAILNATFFPEQGAGADGIDGIPADLLPKSGVYPTERLFFKKLLIDALPPPGETAQPIEEAPPIDLVQGLAAPAGFGRLATGALLTFSQSWFSEGVTLGQLLHSTSLAPGESTRIAVVDWSRRTRAAASEDISESELLSNAMTHSRAISEVTSATATEFQTGSSTTHATSTTEQAGGGFGLDLGPLAIGGSGGTSTTTTDAYSISSSFGSRDLAANYAQDINDRSQQNASSVRNRRASIVREVSQTEHEEISTRVVTNYNHMHALSLHYYEVVQAFRTTTQLERAERCLFVPVKLIDFHDLATVDRWRLVLAGAALTGRARRQLTVEYGVVEIAPETPRITPGRLIATGVAGIRPVLATARLARAATTSATAATGGDGDGASSAPATSPPAAAPSAEPAPAPVTDYEQAPIDSPAAVLARKGWNLDQLNRLGWATGAVLAQRGSDSVFVSDDALLVGASLRDAQAGRFVVRTRDGNEINPADATATGFAFGAPVAITELDSIAVQYAGERELRTSLTLQLSVSGTLMPLDVPIALRPMSVPATVVKFGGVRAQRELVEHLAANQLYYTQAILRSLDSASVAALLARYTYRGFPLAMVADPAPIGVAANFLVFRVNVNDGATRDERWMAEERDWKQWLEGHGLAHPVPRTEVIPLPSGGVFGEAVLGRANAAEKIDLARFWNWQDSPIPLVAPDIAPIQAGSRAQAENLLPGQLSQPVLGIQAPTALPDPTGIAAIIGALQNGNMFRDMSGLAQTAALAQAALQASAQGATAVGQQAAQNLETVVSNQTERMRIAAQLAAQLLTGGVAGAGGAAGSRPAKNATEEGGRLNYARGLDERNGGSADKGANGVGTGVGDSSDGGAVGSDAEFAGDSGGGAGADTTEDTLFDRLTGGPGADAATRLVSASADDLADSGDGGGGDAMAAARGPRTRRRGSAKAVRRTYYFRFGVDINEVRFRSKIGGHMRYVVTADSGKEISRSDWMQMTPTTLPSKTLVFESSERKFWVQTEWLPVPGVDPNDAVNSHLIERNNTDVRAPAPPAKIPKDFKTYVNIQHTIYVVHDVAGAMGPDPVDLDEAIVLKNVDIETVLETTFVGSHTSGGQTKYLYDLLYLGGVQMTATFPPQ